MAAAADYSNGWKTDACLIAEQAFGSLAKLLQPPRELGGNGALADALLKFLDQFDEVIDQCRNFRSRIVPAEAVQFLIAWGRAHWPDPRGSSRPNCIMEPVANGRVEQFLVSGE